LCGGRYVGFVGALKGPWHACHGAPQISDAVGRNGDELPTFLARLAEQFNVVAAAKVLIEEDLAVFPFHGALPRLTRTRKLPGLLGGIGTGGCLNPGFMGMHGSAPVGKPQQSFPRATGQSVRRPGEAMWASRTAAWLGAVRT